MNDTYPDSNSQELEDLLRQVDQLLEEPIPARTAEADDIDILEFQPQGLDEPEEPMLYRNFSNNYGADVKNHANGYGSGAPAEPPAQEPVIPAYNADFRRDQLRDQRERLAREETQYIPVQEPPAPKAEKPPKPKKQKAKRRPGCCGCGCSTMLVALAIVILGVVALVNWVFTPPVSEYSIGERKNDTATILLCGTDEDGTRTDTMMLLYLSGSEKRVGLLSLPRDSYTITAAGNAAKLNSAYGRNGCGEAGMEGLLDYVQDIIGYRPDGYILVDFTLVPQLVDLMGGLEFDVPRDMKVDGVALEEGLQQLTGQQVMTLLRYRKGYATADLGRVQVQRQVIEAALNQWLTADHLANVTDALSLLENNSISSLNWRNYLWMAKTALLGLNNFTNDTLPGYAANRNGASYYFLDAGGVAELVDGSYNPYQAEISSDRLNIAG